MIKFALLFAAVQSLAPAAGKKFISLGWEFIYTPPSVIAEHADSYRGCGLSGANFTLYGTLADGTKVCSNRIAEDKPWTREAFAADEAALKKLSRMPEFSHSFIATLRCPRNRYRWNDDAAWKTYADKVKIAAAIARDSGMVGLSMDNEDYRQSRQFHLCEGDGSYADAAKLARRRGRELFSALYSEFPAAKVFFARMYSGELWNYYYGADDPRRLAESRGDLWVPFLDGALDALPPEGVFYEGDETGYRYDASFGDAAAARVRNQIDLARLAAPEHADKYRRQVRLSLPVYLDCYSSHRKGSRYWAGPVAGSRVCRFERDVTDAVNASDDYVWLYGEQYVQTRWERPRNFHKGRNRGLTVWDDEIPGFNDIMASLQDPAGFCERRLAELKAAGQLENLLPEKFPDGTLPRPLSGWQAKEQPGTFVAKNGEIHVEGVGRGGISWINDDVREGDLYAFEFEVRGKIGFTMAKFHRRGAAHDLSFPPPLMFAPPEGDENSWRRFRALARVPKGSENMLVSAGFKQKPGERARFRNFGYYRLRRTDARVPQPAEVWAEGEGFSEKLVQCGERWIGEKVSVSLVDAPEGGRVEISAPSAALENVRMRWKSDIAAGARVYTDNARGGWMKLGDRLQSQWFFLVERGGRTDGWGVRTQPNSFVAWNIAPGSLEAVFDVRAGGVGVKLGRRVLEAATLLHREGIPGERAYVAGRAFCRMMCPSPRLPKEPVYGYNDWYCAYGKNTATNFLADAAYVTAMAKGLKVRPYVVMDDGWQHNSPPVIKKKRGFFDSGCGPWDRAGATFGMDMKTFAAKVTALGAKPGLWYRPMRAWEEAPDSLKLAGDKRYFDPTVPEVKKRIAQEIGRFRDWGFKLVKADYITHDFFNLYMHNVADVSAIAPANLVWRDRSRTTAEVMLDIYRTIREAAGDGMVVIGCNAVNHFVPGLFEVQRTGRDTSGRSWQKTAECGVNALGMRNMMNGTFYAADPDCVGLAEAGAVPWERNRDWLELIARSKSPLFFSWRRSLATKETRLAFRRAFSEVCSPGEPGEPLDWQENELPSRWRFVDGEREYDWFPAGTLGEFKNGRRELFIGRDLTNWYSYMRGRGRESDPKWVFTVEKSAIRCTSAEPGALTTYETFGGGKLEIEFRGVSADAKLGVRTGCKGPCGAVDEYLMAGSGGEFSASGGTNRWNAVSVDVKPGKIQLVNLKGELEIRRVTLLKP